MFIHVLRYIQDCKSTYKCLRALVQIQTTVLQLLQLKGFVNTLWSEVAVGQTLLSVSTQAGLQLLNVGQTLSSISSQAGLQVLNVLVALTLSPRSFNYDTAHGRVCRTLGHWHCGLETFILGWRIRTHAQSSITACSIGQSATTYTTVAIWNVVELQDYFSICKVNKRCKLVNGFQYVPPVHFFLVPLGWE